MNDEMNEENIFHDLLLKFLQQANTDNLGFKQYSNRYRDLITQVSFGKGNPGDVAWIVFRKQDQQVMNGYYVSIYLDRENKKDVKLFTVLGTSETKTPIKNWEPQYASQFTKFSESDVSRAIGSKYPSSRYVSQYNLDFSNIDDFISNNCHKIKGEIDRLIEEYSKNVVKISKNYDQNALIMKKKQIILYGPPGTGKTFGTRHFSVDIIEGEIVDDINDHFFNLLDEGRIRFITFHPSYSYEEFVEGITVKVGKDGSESQKLEYYLKDGIFKQMSKDCLKSALEINDPKNLTMTELIEKYRDRIKTESAQISPGQTFNTEEWWQFRDKFVLIIDEINRGDMSKIMGELITLLESDKRLGMENELIVTLPYSRELFSVPPNLYIIGTMNTADKSISLLDVALRRRFGFIEMNPDIPLLRKMIESRRSKLGNDLIDLMVKSTDALEIINGRIAKERSIGRDKCIGHAFFFKVESEGDLVMVWRNEIIPTIEEYCYGRQNDLSKILFGTENGTEYFDEVKGFTGLNDTKDLVPFLEGVKRG